ncbi:MAG: hypothetical protein Q9214_001828, partial [Letrouitia sp. 1 TL-2023]
MANIDAYVHGPVSEPRYQDLVDDYYRVNRPASYPKAEWEEKRRYFKTVAEKSKNAPPWVPPPDHRTPDRDESPTAYPSPAPSDNDQVNGLRVAHRCRRRPYSTDASHTLPRHADPYQLSIRIQQQDVSFRTRDRQRARSTITTRSKVSSHTEFLELDLHARRARKNTFRYIVVEREDSAVQ